jgi:molybdopterin/thiamine biosynthesis adenylyltransferase
MVGAGAVGNEVAKNLAMLGLGRLTIVDFDVIELSNTSRMIFFDRRNVGQSKVRVLAKAVMTKYPLTKVVTYESRLEDIPLTAYLEADAIVCGLDNMASRIYLSAIAAKHLVPIVDAGILGYQARIQTYVPPKSPCLACVLPKGQYGQLAGLKNPCDPPIEEGKVASLPTTTSLVSSIQAQEVLKLIIGYPTFCNKGVWPQETGEPLSGVWIADLRFGKFATMPLTKNEKCVVCGKDGMGKDVVRRVDVSLSEMKDSTTTLRKSIVGLLPEKYEDLQISEIGKERSTALVEGKRISRSGIRIGGFLQVTFKCEPDKYQDMIVRLV